MSHEEGSPLADSLNCHDKYGQITDQAIRSVITAGTNEILLTGIELSGTGHNGMCHTAQYVPRISAETKRE
jgi:hypothetical protein